MVLYQALLWLVCLYRTLIPVAVGYAPDESLSRKSSEMVPGADDSDDLGFRHLCQVPDPVP